MRSLRSHSAFGTEQRFERAWVAGRGPATNHEHSRHRFEDTSLLELRNPLVMRDQDRRTAVTDRVTDLQWVILVINRHDDEPHSETGEIDDDRLETIRQQHRDTITLFEAHRCQARGQPRRQPLKFRGGGPRSIVLYDRTFRANLNRTF